MLGTISWSDHAPVSITIGRSGPPRLWSFNASLLADPGNLQRLITEHLSFFEPNDHLDADWFVLIKLHSRTKNQRSQQIEATLSQITQLENQNKQSPSHNLAYKLLA